MPGTEAELLRLQQHYLSAMHGANDYSDVMPALCSESENGSEFRLCRRGLSEAACLCCRLQRFSFWSFEPARCLCYLNKLKLSGSGATGSWDGRGSEQDRGSLVAFPADFSGYRRSSGRSACCLWSTMDFVRSSGDESCRAFAVCAGTGHNCAYCFFALPQQLVTRLFSS
jgi:hypothetical protein